MMVFVRATCNILRRLPASKIYVKHINSKLNVWKKTYYQIMGMQGTSGFRWNDTGKIITVDDDVWALYVKAHPHVANMRFKTYPYYEDWVEIFEKDRATGDGAGDVVEIVEDLVRSNTVNPPNKNGKEPMIDTNSTDYVYSRPCVDLTKDASDGGEFGSQIPPYNMGFQNTGPKVNRLTKKIK